MAQHDTYESIEAFCERRGFTFHAHGRGKWGAFPYYTFERAEAETQRAFKIVHLPHTNTTTIESAQGTFRGTVETVDVLRQLLEAMGIGFDAVDDRAVAHDNAVFKMERKLELAKRIAARIQQVYGFRTEKCVDMAMRGDWWAETCHISQLSNRQVDDFAAQVLADIKSGKID